MFKLTYNCFNYRNRIKNGQLYDVINLTYCWVDKPEKDHSPNCSNIVLRK
jgi:hypothetical protein